MIYVYIAISMFCFMKLVTPTDYRPSIQAEGWIWFIALIISLYMASISAPQN